MIRPIADGLIVRMEPPATMTDGGLHIPDSSQAETGTWRAQRGAKIGHVLAVGPGRARRRRTSWERDAKATGPLTPDDMARMWDRGGAGSLVPMTVRVGDRVLFDPVAELRPLPDGTWGGAEFQVAAILEYVPPGGLIGGPMPESMRRAAKRKLDAR